MIKTHICRKFCAVSGFIIAIMLLPLTASAEIYEAQSAMQDETNAVTVNGTVLDSAGWPLIGASVLEQGTLNGTITDIDGNFSLKTKKGAVLEVSCIGFKTVTIVAENETPLTITLVEDSELLNEVVVTALGIKREEKALSYNVQSVDGEALNKVKDANFVNSLNGKVAGVIINSSSAGPGAAARVVMRGSKSLDKDNNALYVIDGIPMFNVSSGNQDGGTMGSQPGSNSAADLNPEDIESITVLTGPSAAALYGYQAANGVILVTTKKGAEGKTKVTFSNSTSFSNPVISYDFQNTYGNLEGNSTSWGDKLATPTSFTPRDFFRTGVDVINGLTFSTGNEKNQTYISVSTTNSTGIIPTSEYNRYNFSFRNTAKFAKEKLTLDVGAQYVIQDNTNLIGGGQYFNPIPALYLFPRGESFDEVRMFERYNSTRSIMEQYWPSSRGFSTAESMQNPYWIIYRMPNTLKKNRYMFNASLKYDVTDWLNIITRVRVDNSTQDAYNKRYATTVGTFTEGSDKGFYSHSSQKDRSTYADVIANINKTWEDWSLHVNIGAAIDDRASESLHMNGGLNTIPNFFHWGNIDMNKSKRNESGWREQTQSVFASAEAGWNRMVYLTLTGRNDWDSKLAYTDQISFFYPSVGLSFVASELFDLPMGLPYLKLRASWSEVGAAPSRNMTLVQFSYSEQTDSYALPTSMFNPDLKPERTRSWELGLSAKFVEGRINLDATWYKSNTFNQTFYIPVSASTGYKNKPIQAGNVQNSGVEIALGYSDSYVGDQVKFSTNFTFTHNDNNTLQLAEDAMENGYLDKGTLGISGGPQIRLTEGGSMGDLYINKRIRQSPNGYYWLSSVGGLATEETEWQKIGSTLAKFHAGWNTSVSYAGVNLGIQFTGRFGGLVVSDTQAMIDRYGVSQASVEAREKGGIDVGFGRTVTAKNYYETISTMPGTYYMYDATNIRLSELSLSYDLPKAWFKEKVGLTVGITGKNLWMIYCKAPFDPESAASVSSNYYQGVDYFMTPSTRSFGFNVKLSF